MTYKHSVKLPTTYRKATKFLRDILLNKKSLKTLIYQDSHIRVGRLQVLLSNIINKSKLLDKIIDECEILKNENRLDPYLCRVLLAELIFGNQKLSGESKPIVTILNYKEKIFDIWNRIENTCPEELKNDKAEIQIPRYIRVNTLLYKTQEFLLFLTTNGWRIKETNTNIQNYDEFLLLVNSLNNDEFLHDYNVKDVFVFPKSSSKYWATHELANESKILLQDKATCLAGSLLDPPFGSTILDMCAAPGMKTTHLAAIIKNRGKIYAVEQNLERYQLLCSYIKNSKAKSVQTINCDALKLTNKDLPNVDYVVVDPSCTGSGLIGRFGDTDKDPTRLKKLASIQVRLLMHAMRSFPNVKKIVYSTCSIYQEENEEVVKEALEKCKQFKLIKLNKILKDKWNNFGSSDYKHIGKKCIYARSDTDMTKGFFLAMFERVADDEIAIENMNEEIIPNGKNSKKRKHCDENEITEPVDGTNVNESEDKPLKKKSKKQKYIESMEVEAQPQEIEEPLDNPTKKKKKSKKVTDTTVSVGEENETPNEVDKEMKKIKNITEEEQNNIASDETVQKKKKKSKKQLDNVEAMHEHDEQTAEILNENDKMVEQPSKKKSKKNKRKE